MPALTAGALFYLVSSTLAASALFLLVELIERARSSVDIAAARGRRTGLRSAFLRRRAEPPRGHEPRRRGAGADRPRSSRRRWPSSAWASSPARCWSPACRRCRASSASSRCCRPCSAPTAARRRHARRWTFVRAADRLRAAGDDRWYARRHPPLLGAARTARRRACASSSACRSRPCCSPAPCWSCAAEPVLRYTRATAAGAAPSRRTTSTR